MSIVNNILNKVDLNTTKYSEKLRKMGRDTKKQSKGIGQDFAAMGAAWKSAIAAIATGAMAGAVSKELIATEKSVAAFIESTGSLADARAQFELLQQAARDTIQPFDALKAAALDLRRNGIEPTAAQLKTFSQIAYSSGQSLETVASAFTGVLRGNYRGLQQLGIKAQDTGDRLVLTYKGVTTEIKKNTGALAEYFDEIGRQNDGALEYLQSGLTGAVNHMENAWGDFTRAIGESGLGDLFRDMVRDAASSLDDITAWINDNREPIREFFKTITESWDSIVTATKDSVKIVKDTVNDLWESSGLAAATGTNNMIDALSQFFNFARAGFLEVAKWATNAWTAIRGGFQAVGEGIGNWLGGGEFGTAYNRVLNATADQIGKDTENFNGTIKTYHAEISKNLQRLADANLGYKDLKPGEVFNYRSWEQGGAPESREFGQQTTTTTGGKRGGGGRKSAPKPEKDGWPEYFAGVKALAKNGYTAVEKLRAEHGERIQELNRQFAESNSASDAEYLAAKKIIDDDYMRQFREQQQEARDFLRDMRADETEAIDAEYRERLERLRLYHEQGFLLEQEYQQGLADIRKDYEKKRDETKTALPPEVKKETESLRDIAGGVNTLSDAFSNLTQGLSESSASYKALFALQKSFAVASATVNAFAAWIEALNTKPFIPAGIAAYANAVALTTGIIGQLQSVTMHDKGGRIPAGGLGIVGEYGPEIVEGPAQVTSRRKTAELARGAIAGGDVTVNLYEDASRAGQTESETAGDGERIINIFVSNIRRGGRMATALENTYQIRRYGA
ncbi:MAG: hypothetical protein VZR11_13200 [Succinimonas sp.]|nr:hypothetical protein [Succinimonas sp.]